MFHYDILSDFAAFIYVDHNSNLCFHSDLVLPFKTLATSRAYKEVPDGWKEAVLNATIKKTTEIGGSNFMVHVLVIHSPVELWISTMWSSVSSTCVLQLVS